MLEKFLGLTFNPSVRPGMPKFWIQQGDPAKPFHDIRGEPFKGNLTGWIYDAKKT